MPNEYASSAGTATAGVSDGVIERARSIPSANIGDAQERLGTASGIRPVWDGAQLAGRALPVWTRPGDNLIIHKALDVAQPGDVLVVNGGGDVSRALIGDLIGLRALRLGVAGFVIDGAIRDTVGLGEIGLPVFARAVTPAGPFKFGPGRIGIPVAISGVVVEAGDLIVADDDGVVVVRGEEADEVITRAEEIEAGERRKRIAIEESAGVRV